MTHDPFLDQPMRQAPDELDVPSVELEGCARVLLALFGVCTILSAFAAVAIELGRR
jgi:hypothetical protein